MREFPDGTVVNGWRFERELGRGAFGVVSLWTNQATEEKIVIKQCGITLDDRNRKRWVNEIAIMQTKRHPNLVAGCEVPVELASGLQAPEKLLALEFCDSDLRRILSLPEHCCGLPEKTVLNVLHDISSGIDFLHGHDIVHRDLKPENILIMQERTGPVFKITDLGYAKQLDASSLVKSFVGTIQYVAPELWNYPVTYTETADYWSFGTVIFECITGIRPFVLTDIAVMWPKLLKEKKDEDIWGYCANGAVRFSPHLPVPNHVCEPLQNALARWLRVVLRLDPAQRGGLGKRHGISESNRLVSKILNTKIIRVLSMENSKEASYEVSPGQTVSHLKQFLERTLDVPVAQQELLFAASDYSNVLNESDSLEVCLNQPDEIFLLRKQAVFGPASPKVRPEKVAELVAEEDKRRKYDELKSYWAHAFQYCLSVADEYKRLMRGQRAVMIALRYYNVILLQLKERMTASALRLEALSTFYNLSYRCDRKNYCALVGQCSLDEQTFVGEWERMDEMAAQYKTNSSVRDLDSRIVQVQKDFISLKQLLLQDVHVDNELNKVALIARQGYEKLRHLSPEHRKVDHRSEYIRKCVQRCESLREKLLNEFYASLSKVVSCKEEMARLVPLVEARIKDFDDKQEQIKMMQSYRQDMQWRLFYNRVRPPTSAPTCTTVDPLLSSLSSLVILDCRASASKEDVVDNMERVVHELRQELEVHDSLDAVMPSDPLETHQHHTPAVGGQSSFEVRKQSRPGSPVDNTTSSSHEDSLLTVEAGQCTRDELDSSPSLSSLEYHDAADFVDQAALPAVLVSLEIAGDDDTGEPGQWNPVSQPTPMTQLGDAGVTLPLVPVPQLGPISLVTGEDNLLTLTPGRRDGQRRSPCPSPRSVTMTPRSAQELSLVEALTAESEARVDRRSVEAAANSRKLPDCDLSASKMEMGLCVRS